MIRPLHTPRRGVALVIALSFIVLVAILVVGLSESVRTERSAVRTHLERQRAQMLSQQGIDLVMARLQQFTVDAPQAENETEAQFDARIRHWISQPGRLLIADPQDERQPKRIASEVLLSSGLPSPTLLDGSHPSPDFAPPNLNEPLLLDPATHLITEEFAADTNATVKMPLRWVYVRKDGSLDRRSALANDEWEDTPDTTILQNPIIGRFAFWADDEGTKVNANLAWTRDPARNTNPPGHPTRIDLRALPGFTPEMANNLHSFVTTNNYVDVIRFFNTPFDARHATGRDLDLLAVLDRNRFNLTHYNHDPDTTYFARPRMVLTTRPQSARGRPFLDILLEPEDLSADTGLVKNIDSNKLGHVIENLVENYLKRDDWPITDAPGASLQSKYYGNKKERLAQLALNIIDYVRSAESSKPLVEPIRAKYINNRLVGDWNRTSLRGEEDTYKGLTRAPHITELGFWMAPAPEASGPHQGRYRCLFFTEIHLPENYGLPQINLLAPEAGKRLFVYHWETGQNNNYYTFDNGRLARTAGVKFWRIDGPTGSDRGNILEAWRDPSKVIMKAGEYRTLVREFWRSPGRNPQNPNAVININLRGAISIGTDNNNDQIQDSDADPRLDVAPLGDPNKGPAPIIYRVDPPHIGETAVSSYETDDPRVNGVARDWKRVDRNSFGLRNASTTIGRPASTLIMPRQDQELDGTISSASLLMPFPKGHSRNLSGRVRSSGELGIIHTGIEGSSIAPGGGVPWRTLRLQPSHQDTKVVPDWAFMDLFTPPVDVPSKAARLFSPHGNTTGGRVNMNARPEPFTSGAYALLREDPLAAVLAGCRRDSVDPSITVSPELARTLARNIYERRLAPSTNFLPAGKQYGNQNAAFHCYESPGEVVEIRGIADRGERSEELVREIANLITARSNTFSVYTIGQALKQTPSGRLISTAEQRQHAIIERYSIGDSREVRLRTVYYRNLIP
jgi:hypothetical protein